MSTLATRSALVTALLALTLSAIALLPAPAGAATGSSPHRTTVHVDSSSVTVDSSAPTSSAANADDDSANWTDDSDGDNDSGTDTDTGRHHHRLHHRDNDLVSVGHDSNLPAGETRDSVVAVFGSATSNGTATQDVVSVFGDTVVNGMTGDSAVAVLGNVTVNADVAQDVVAVLGNVTLGPSAHVHGDVVSVLGTLTRDPGAIVDGDIQNVLPENLAGEGVRRWFTHGLMMGRPLILGSGLEWLWGFSIALLVLYTIIALLFRDATEHCIATLDENPGMSLVTAILAVVLTPLMLFLLAITIVGILAIPIALVLLFIAGIFGKTTVLGWIGGRCFGRRSGHAAPHPAIAVLVGGLIVTLVYLVPVLGFVVYILLSMIGYGAVLFALLNRMRAHSSRNVPPSGPAPGPTLNAHTNANAEAAAAGASAAAAAAAAAAAPHFTEEPAAAAAAVPLSTLPRAGFWVRMGALLLDAIIIGVLVHVLFNWYDTANHIYMLGLAVYGAVMWKFKGTTIGGIVFDLRVVRLDSRELDWPTVCVRALGCILSLFALGLGFIWIAVDAGNQAWHDKLAGTVVVRVPKGTPLV